MKTAALACISLLALASCDNDADVASRNLSTAADNFEVNRRVVFYNGITGDYILEIQGLCSLGNAETGKRMSVTCKVGPNAYKKHFLGPVGQRDILCRADRASSGQQVLLPSCV